MSDARILENLLAGVGIDELMARMKETPASSVQRSGRQAVTKPELHRFRLRAPAKINLITLKCLTPTSAKRVVEEFPGQGGDDNTMHLVGNRVEIRYFDKRWPLDIANWAFTEGLASDSDSGKVIRCL